MKSTSRTKKITRCLGFTIVELLVVIVVIGVLATIVIVSYNGWKSSVTSTLVKNELQQAGAAMKSEATFKNAYPSTIPNSFTPSPKVTLTLFEHSDDTFCIDGVSTEITSIVYYIDNTAIDTTGPQSGTCATRPATVVPSVPTGLAKTGGNSVSVTLSWNANIGVIASYQVQCATDAIYTQNVQSATVSHPTTTATVSGYSASTSLYCHILGTNSKGNSAWSTSILTQTSAPPATPVLTATTNSSVDAIFSWPAVSGASSYTFQYNLDGGSWIDGFTDQNTLTYTLSGMNGHTINGRALAKDSAGSTSSYSTVASTVTPLWGTFTYQNNWANYGGSYATGGFTKTSAGVVILKGLLTRTSGSITTNEVIATLPPAYRPANTSTNTVYTFMTQVSGTDSGSIKIASDGNIMASTNTSETATSLDRIAYTTGNDYTPLTLLSGWAQYGTDTPALGYKVDSVGRVILKGSLDPGATGSVIANLPTSSPDLSVSPKLIIPFRAGCNGYVGVNIDNALTTRGQCMGSAVFAQTMYYPNAASPSWTTMTLKNSWVVFNASSNATPQYTKASDGIVTLKGLIKSGSTSNGVVLFTLPAGYRPAATLTLASMCGDLPCRIDIQADGDVLGRGVDSGWTSLSGLNFVAEQ